MDAYVACRDAYREFKVSLHATGIWRLGFTEKAVTDRADLLAKGADRAWKKWTPNMDDATKVVVAFEIPFLAQSLFLKPDDRTDWPSSVLFIEPPGDPEKMTVVSIAVARSHAPAAIDPGIDGGIIAVLPLDDNRSLQLLAHYKECGPLKNLITDSFPRVVDALGDSAEAMPDRGILFLHGDKDIGIPWVTVVPVAFGRKQEKG